MVLPLSTVSMLFGSTQSSGGVDFSFITRGQSGASATADVGSIKLALANADKNEARQRADVANTVFALLGVVEFEIGLAIAAAATNIRQDHGDSQFVQIKLRPAGEIRLRLPLGSTVNVDYDRHLLIGRSIPWLVIPGGNLPAVE